MMDKFSTIYNKILNEEKEPKTTKKTKKPVITESSEFSADIVSKLEEYGFEKNEETGIWELGRIFDPDYLFVIKAYPAETDIEFGVEIAKGYEDFEFDETAIKAEIDRIKEVFEAFGKHL